MPRGFKGEEMNKKTIILVAIIAILLLGTGGAYATSQIAKSNAITEADAINFAYVDAGVMPEDATVTKVEFDFSQGRFVYEIEFIAGGTEYEYVIDSNNGNILGKNFEIVDALAAGAKPNSGQSNTAGNHDGINHLNESDIIGIEKAKEMIKSGKAKAKLEQFIADSNK